MMTKAQKLRAKRKAQLGRPRKANAERFACGKIKPEWSKRESEKEAMAVALAARKRMHGLRPEAPLPAIRSGACSSTGGSRNSSARQVTTMRRRWCAITT